MLHTSLPRLEDTRPRLVRCCCPAIFFRYFQWIDGPFWYSCCTALVLLLYCTCVVIVLHCNGTTSAQCTALYQLRTGPLHLLFFQFLFYVFAIILKLYCCFTSSFCQLFGFYINMKVMKEGTRVFVCDVAGDSEKFGASIFLLVILIRVHFICKDLIFFSKIWLEILEGHEYILSN